MALSADDKLAIMERSSRYTHASDLHQPEAWADVFTPDGKLEAPQGTSEGREALIAFAGGVNQNMPNGRHYVSNLVIEGDGDGDGATMSSYLNLIDTKDGNKSVFTARYEDELTRGGGEWKFATRKIVI